MDFLNNLDPLAKLLIMVGMLVASVLVFTVGKRRN